MKAAPDTPEPMYWELLARPPHYECSRITWAMMRSQNETSSLEKSAHSFDPAEATRRATKLFLKNQPGVWLPAKLARYAGFTRKNAIWRWRKRSGSDPVIEALVPLEYTHVGTDAPRQHVHRCGSGKSSIILALQELLGHWEEVAKASPADDVPRDSILAARDVTAAAREVRRSMFLDPPEVSEASIGAFAVTWLGRKKNPRTIADVGDAILFADLDGELTVDLLRKQAELYGRRNELLTARPFCRRRVESLEQVGRLDITRCVVVGSSGPISPDVEVERRLEPFADDRIGRVLAQLQPDELKVAQAWAHDPKLSWVGAAEACGRVAAFGTRVQRKLTRLGHQFRSRTAALA
ncbi:hypothetical protein [Amycolatopsis coloradensis]|nr:hypothetical protein [Amycolatopsis coloradensis]